MLLLKILNTSKKFSDICHPHYLQFSVSGILAQITMEIMLQKLITPSISAKVTVVCEKISELLMAMQLL